MRLSLRALRPAREIHLDEDVYVVLGGAGRGHGRARSAWPAPGRYGPIPREGVVGGLAHVLDELGTELWTAKRRGDEVCLGEPVACFDMASVLAWGADCVEHLARRALAVDGNVVESLQLARAYAADRQFRAQDAHRLAAEAEQLLTKLRKGGIWAAGRALVSRAGELDVGGFGLLNPAETRYEAGEYATAALRAVQVAVLHATKELCGADPLLAGREAARWCRRGSARLALERETGDRANGAEEASFMNLWLNPFAQGTLARSLPGQISALEEGADPEAQWQAARLRLYLAGESELPPAAP